MRSSVLRWQARARLRELRFPKSIVNDVARLVELHLRFHGYGTGEWADSAVRRYVRDAGPLLSRLHVLTRADCTTKNQARAARLASAYDALEQRIARLTKEEELAEIRPDLNGHEIMRVLGPAAGPRGGRSLPFPARPADRTWPARPRASHGRIAPQGTRTRHHTASRRPQP
jgi:poly(A) polymerase